MKKYLYDSNVAGKKGSLFQGMRSIPSSLSTVREHKSLLTYFVIPFLLNVLVLSGVFSLAWLNIYPWLDGLLQGDAWYIRALQFIIGPLLVLALSVVTVFSYSILGNIITAPFNDFLSQKVEEVKFGEDFDEPFSLKAIIADVARAVKNALKLVGLMILINGLLLVLNIVPGIGSAIYSVFNILVTSFFLGFQFFDFPLERRRFIFAEKMRIMRTHMLLVTGVGLGFFIISFIPLVGFLGLNLGTIGATELFQQFIKPKLKELNNS